MTSQNYGSAGSRITGSMGEKLALRYLEGKGYDLIVQNYFIRGGEIDLIMQKNGILIFVEVKTRRNQNFGRAAEALTSAKKRKMLRAINNYLSRLGGFTHWRADLIAIDFTSRNEANITHYQDIFEK
jgi:putative endonuclease